MKAMRFCTRWLRAASLVIVSLVTLGSLGLFTDASPSEAQGVSASSLFEPEGVAVDSSGNVYVAERQNNRVLEYSANCASTGCSATRVFGQASFTDFISVSTTSAAVISPQGVAVDGSGNLYVVNGGDRVLEFPSDCAATGCSATRVFGQTSFTSITSSSYGSGTAASTLGPQPSGVAVDSSGNLYVADTANNRVLEYPHTCASTGCSATRVFGQTSFTGYQSGSVVSASSLSSPSGVAVDGNGNLYVVDNYVTRDLDFTRVLEFPANCPSVGCSATRVFGQTSFTGTSSGITASMLAGPADGTTGVAVDGSGNILVADTNNERVLEFASGCDATGCSATRVFGQTSFTSRDVVQGHSAATLFGPRGVAVDSSGNVYVADMNNDRVLEFPAGCGSTGCSASRVFGQTDFGSAPLPRASEFPSPTSVAPTSAPPSEPDAVPPSAPDAATLGTPSAPDSIAAPDTLTDSLRADILAAVDRGNAAWTTAQQSLDPADLQSGLTGQELTDDIRQIAELQSAGQTKKPVNTAFRVVDLSLDSPTRSTVHTQETWSDAVYNSTTGALIRQDPPTNYSETYTLELIDGQWTVSQIQLQ